MPTNNKETQEQGYFVCQGLRTDARRQSAVTLAILTITRTQPTPPLLHGQNSSGSPYMMIHKK